MLGRWDKRRRFRLFDFVLAGNKYAELSNKYKVCLATQSSIERLNSLTEVSNHWEAPISLSVFVAGNELSLVELYVNYLTLCFPETMDRVSLHYVISPDHPPTTEQPNIAIYENCDDPEGVLKELLTYQSNETKKWKETMLYPQNILRNQARSNCHTSHVLVTDIDIIPSYGMTEGIDLFLKRELCDNLCAYVVPVYEVSENASFPMSKSDIINLHNLKLARPFHEKIFSVAQSSTDYKR